jgi:hypothetical protein
MGGHQLRHHRLQIGQHFYLRKRLFLDWIHSYLDGRRRNYTN